MPWWDPINCYPQECSSTSRTHAQKTVSNCSLTWRTVLSVTVCQLCPRKARIHTLQLPFHIRPTINKCHCRTARITHLEPAFFYLFIFLKSRHSKIKHSATQQQKRGRWTLWARRQRNSLNQTLLFFFFSFFSAPTKVNLWSWECTWRFEATAFIYSEPGLREGTVQQDPAHALAKTRISLHVRVNKAAHFRIFVLRWCLSPTMSQSSTTLLGGGIVCFR